MKKIYFIFKIYLKKSESIYYRNIVCWQDRHLQTFYKSVYKVTNQYIKNTIYIVCEEEIQKVNMNHEMTISWPSLLLQ